MITLKKIHILMLRIWLDVPLHGELLIARNKFIRAIEPVRDEIESYRKSLLNEMSDKDESGEPILENGIYKIADDKKESFIAQYNDIYLEEEVQVDCTCKHDIKTILMEKMTKGLGIEDGKQFDEILEQLS